MSIQQRQGSISSLGSSDSDSSSTSPLDSFAGVSGALNSAVQESPVNDEQTYHPHRRGSVEDTEQAVRRYKDSLLNYHHHSFDEFKLDVEKRSRSNSTPVSPNLSIHA